METEGAGNRMPGLLLSLIVPGFGLVWAGRFWRGGVWFVVVALLWMVAMVLPLLRDVAGLTVLAVAILALLATALMLVDCARPGRSSGVAWWFFGVGCALGLLLAGGYLVGCRQFLIRGGSMHPTLQCGKDGGRRDRVLVERFSYRFSKPRRGDLVVFRTRANGFLQEASVFVSRIAGLPGERMSIRDGKVWADGRALGKVDGIPEVDYQLPHPGSPITPAMDGNVEFAVPTGGYFVLGDNTFNSLDSRYWGHVPEKDLIGRVAWIVFPPDRAGKPE